ncbi:hypothetical protein GGI21_006727, partial [Coemansia aciculifera]
MYPLFRQRVSVNVPSQLISEQNFSQGLNLRIFIQKAGQFTPHPNLSDTRLISSRIPLVKWKDVSLDEPVAVTSVPREKKAVVPELVCVTSASWAIVLENQAYNWLDVYGKSLAPFVPEGGGFYNPPLLRNEFTKSRPKVQPLAALKSEQSTSDVYPQTIDVDLELSGIKLGWIYAGARLDIELGPVDKTVIFDQCVTAPWDPSETVTVQRAEVVKVDGDIPLDAVRRLSAPLKFVFILCRALMDTASPMFAILGLYILLKPMS